MIKKIVTSMFLLFLVACGSGDEENNSSNNSGDINNTPVVNMEYAGSFMDGTDRVVFKLKTDRYIKTAGVSADSLDYMTGILIINNTVVIEISGMLTDINNWNAGAYANNFYYSISKVNGVVKVTVTAPSGVINERIVTVLDPQTVVALPITITPEDFIPKSMWGIWYNTSDNTVESCKTVSKVSKYSLSSVDTCIPKNGGAVFTRMNENSYNKFDSMTNNEVNLWMIDYDSTLNQKTYIKHKYTLSGDTLGIAVYYRPSTDGPVYTNINNIPSTPVDIKVFNTDRRNTTVTDLTRTIQW